MATIEEVMARSKAKKKKLISFEKAVPNSMKESAAELDTFDTALGKKIGQGIIAGGLQALDWAKKGRLDQFDKMVPALEGKKLLDYTDFTEGKGLWERFATSLYSDFPALETMVNERVEGEEFSTKPFGWVELTERENALFDEWSSTDPFEGPWQEFVPNALKAAAGQGANMTFAATQQYGGGLALYDVMRRGLASQAEGVFESRDYGWDPALYDDEMHASSLAEMGLESIGMGVSLASISGRNMLKNNLKKSLPKVAAAIGVVSPAAAEYLTEFTQSLSSDHTINKMLKKYADANGLPYEPITQEEILANANKQGRVGAVTGGIFGLGGAVVDSTKTKDTKETPVGDVKMPTPEPTLLSQGDFDNLTATPTTTWTEETADGITLVYEQTAEGYGEDALQLADAQLLDLLDKESTENLLKMARAFKLPLKTGQRMEIMSVLMENRMRLPMYQELGLSNVLDLIKNKQPNVRQRNYYKWMAQGDVRQEDLVQLTTVMQAAVRNSTYDGTYDELLEEMVTVFGDERGMIEYNQLNGGINGIPVGRMLEEFLVNKGQDPDKAARLGMEVKEMLDDGKFDEVREAYALPPAIMEQLKYEESIYKWQQKRAKDKPADDGQMELFQTGGLPDAAVKAGYTTPAFHETGAADFEVFDKDRSMAASDARSGPGFYFTSQQGQGHGMFKGREMAVALKMDNPLRMGPRDHPTKGFTKEELNQVNEEASIPAYVDSTMQYLFSGTLERWADGRYHIKSKTRGDETGFFPAELVEELGLVEGQPLTKEEAFKVADAIVAGKIDSRRNFSQDTVSSFYGYQIALQKMLKSKGYDSIIHTQGNGVEHYVVFDSEQVKDLSAKDFDSTDPVIFHQTEIGKDLRSLPSLEEKYLKMAQQRTTYSKITYNEQEDPRWIIGEKSGFARAAPEILADMQQVAMHEAQHGIQMEVQDEIYDRIEERNVNPLVIGNVIRRAEQLYGNLTRIDSDLNIREDFNNSLRTLLRRARNDPDIGIRELLNTRIAPRNKFDQMYTPHQFALGELHYTIGDVVFRAIQEMSSNYVTDQYNSISKSDLSARSRERAVAEANRDVSNLLSQLLGDSYMEMLDVVKAEHQIKVKIEPQLELAIIQAQEDAAALSMAITEITEKYDDLSHKDILIHSPGINDSGVLMPAIWGVNIDFVETITRPEADRLRALGDKALESRSMAAKFMDEAGIKFYQRGRTLDSGSQVVRAQLSILAEGKYMIDLFKTGDILSLMHEHMHFLSKWTTPAMKQAIITSMVAERKGLDKEQIIELEDELSRVWDYYQADPFTVKQKLNSRELDILTEMQEHLALNFEKYLMGVAPHPSMVPVFKTARDAMLKYYTQTRQEPLRYQDVHPSLAEQFDALLAGPMALKQDDVTRRVKLPDSEGNIKEYNIVLSRPRDRQVKAYLRGLRTALKEIDSTKTFLLDYTDIILGSWSMSDEGPVLNKSAITQNHKNAVAAVENRRQALAYMRAIDVEYAKREEAKRKKELKAVEKKIKRMLKIARDSMPDDIKVALQEVLDTIDQDPKTIERARKAYHIDKAFKKLTNMMKDELAEIPEELRNATPEDLKDANIMLTRRSIHDLSAKELRGLWGRLDDIQRYNRHRVQQALEEVLKQQESLNKKLRMENNGNWRFKKGNNALPKKGVPLGPFRMLSQLSKAQKIETKRMLLVLRTFANGNPDSVWNKLADDLEDGRTTELATSHMFHDFLRDLRDTLPSQGVSNTLGYVKDSEKIEVELQRVGALPARMREEALASMRNEFDKKYLSKLSPEDKQLSWDGQVAAAIKDNPAAKSLMDRIMKMEQDGKIDVTLGQLMMWYGYAQNDHARRSLLEGGVKFRDQVEETYHFRSEEELYSMIAKLPQQYKDVVDAVMEYYDKVVWPILLEAYKDLNLGISLKKEDFYLPLFRQIANIGNAEFISMHNLGMKKGDWLEQHIQNLGFLNLRTNSSDPVYAEDFFAGVATNMNNIAFYIGMAKPLIQARTQIFGQEKVPGSVWYQAVKMSDQATLDNIKKWLDNLESPGPRVQSDIFKVMIKMNALARKGILNLSASISAIQPVSTVLGLNYGITAKELSKAAGMEFTDQRKTIAFFMNLHPILRERYERIPVVAIEQENYTGKARRAWTRPTSMMKDVQALIEGKHMSHQDIMDLIARSEDSSMMTLMYFDSRALSMLYNGSQMQAERKGWSDEKMLSHFLMIVTRTQPMNDPLYTSNFLGTREVGFKLTWGVFHSARDGLRGEFQWWMEYANDAANNPAYDAAETKRRMRKAMLNIFVALYASSALVGFIQELFARIGDDDEEGELLDEEGMLDFVASWGLRSVTNMMSIDPVGGTFAAAIINYMARGWEINLADMPLASVVAETGMKFGDLMKAMVDDKEDNVWPAFVEFTAAYAKSLGNGWGNVHRQWDKWFGSDEEKL